MAKDAFDRVDSSEKLVCNDLFRELFAREEKFA